MGLVKLGYRPRQPFQAFHGRKQRFACIVAHRRAGKTVAAVCDLIDAALRCDKPKDLNSSIRWMREPADYGGRLGRD